MKKIICLLLCLILSVMMIPGAAAESADAEYPAVRINPATGKAWDLGGKTVYLYDWWSGAWDDPDWERNNEQQATYDYRKWIEKTYNCKIVTGTDGDWGSIAEKVADFTANPDGSLRIYTIASSFIQQLVMAHVLSDWKKITTINLSAGKWSKSTIDYMTVGGLVLGTYVGNHEPRQVLFFNKRLLEEAGIDWNSLYNMQKKGTWTFDAFEKVLKQIHRDLDGDGETDTWGLIGNKDDLLRISVFANGGSFFDLDDKGRLSVTAENEKTVAALDWARSIWAKYARQGREGENWDYYNEVWPEGSCGFFIGQAYQGFSHGGTVCESGFDWGCVAFPKGPDGTKYVSIVNDNITVIPKVYSESELAQIGLIYDLWTDPTPGYFSSDEWIGDKYTLTDARAVEETYAMLRSEDSSVIDLAECLGSVNDIEGAYLLWGMDDETEMKALIGETVPAWQEIVDYYNNNASENPYYAYDVLMIPEGVKAVEAEAFEGAAAEVVILPSGCASVGARAFADCPNLQIVVMPESLTEIAGDAFEGSNPQIIRK